MILMKDIRCQTLAHFDSAGKCCFAALANSGALSRYGKGTTLHIAGADFVGHILGASVIWVYCGLIFMMLVAKMVKCCLRI